MGGIFISYRRDGSSAYAGRLSDRLRSHFGDHHVFMDVDGIEPGVDYQAMIDSTIDTVDVMVALIGRQWLTTRAPTGSRRLDDPDDLVRREIARALERQIRVIPVLVDGATMPTVRDLPPPLIPLAHRNAIEISDARWDYDSQRLVTVLEKVLGAPEARGPVADPPPTPTPASTEPSVGRRRRQPQRALTAVAATAAAVVLVWGVLAPRPWHSEWAGLRIAFEAILVMMVVAGLWFKRWKWVSAGGVAGVLGLLVWAQLLLSGGHTMSDVFTSPDGASNIVALMASAVVLVAGAVGTRAEQRQTAAGDG